jgi:hypothetical protein
MAARKRKPRSYIDPYAPATVRDPETRLHLAVTPDAGPRERYQHGDVIEAPGKGDVTAKARVRSTFDTYLSRGYISEEQWTAGDRLRQDWYMAGFEPRCTSVLDDTPRGGDHEIQDRVVIARRRVAKARERLGDLGWPIVEWVVLEDRKAAEFIRNAPCGGGGHESHIGAALLRMALNLLLTRGP